MSTGLIGRVRHRSSERPAEVYIWEPAGGAAVDGTILYLHGLGAYSGRHAEEFAGELGKHGAYRVIAPDMPGYGRSPAVAFDDYGPQPLVAWLEKYVLDECAEPVHVVGHSWGAETALHLAAERPGLLRSIALLDAGHQDWGPTTIEDAMASALSFDEHWRFDSVESFLEYLEPTAALSEAYRESVVERDGMFHLRQKPETYAAVRMAAAAHPVSQTWSRLGSMPVLLVLAADAEVKPFRPRVMIEQVDDLSLVVLDDCTHFVIDDAGLRLPGLLVPWWQGHRPPMPEHLAEPARVTP